MDMSLLDMQGLATTRGDNGGDRSGVCDSVVGCSIICDCSAVCSILC